ncbi:MAG TPA: hypothetical protein VMZ69_04900 [Saprospiraceae bacterium]|nr:hypothetical protein [Saprospiraceae bacterium]
MSSFDTDREFLLNRIYNINEKDFDTVAMDLWEYQFRYNELYKSFCNLLALSPLNVQSVSEIPFLPISMFREKDVKTGNWDPEVIFRSSGTTGSRQSKHLIRDLDWYHQNAEKTFNHHFGDPSEYVWIALLPSYLERPDSSLVDMVTNFMQKDKKHESGFFSEVNNKIIEVLQRLSLLNQKTILIGVSYALLDLFEKYDVPVWDQFIVIETGGMKGRGQEITKDELHGRLNARHHQLSIASEYGMTELLSQAYLKREHFYPGATMKAFTRDISDPMTMTSFGKRGVINVIDVANIDTCSFIATDDIGIVYEDGSFDVLGRLDQSDVRGCNLLYV